MSAVRLRPWPPFTLILFNSLHSLAFRCSSIKRFTLKLLCSFCWLLVGSVELIELGGRFFHGPFIGDGIPTINGFSLVSDHFHRVATRNTGALKIADGGSAKIMGNPVADFLDQLAIR